jgi:hypothetical protein
MKILQCISTAVFAVAASSACAAHFSFKDWDVACDNTRGCEAAGYQSEEGGSAPVVLWLGRAAGGDAAFQVKLTAIAADDAPVGPLTLQVGQLVLRGLKSEALLTPEQVQRLLPQLLDASNAKVSDGKKRWELSLAGLKAALLKMDDVQGRIGTTTSLVRSGAKPAGSVPPPLPMPTVRPLAPAAERKEDAKLLPTIVSSLQHGGCDETPDLFGGKSANEIHRLSKTQVLLLIECGRGAYQSSYGIWVANDTAPYMAKRAMLPQPEGQAQSEVLGVSFDKGLLSSYGRGRGLNDCNVQAEWAWTADGFALASASSSRLCRGVPGGYALRDWTAKVLPSQ